MTTRVAIVGGTGKLGGVIREVVEAEEGYEVFAVLGSRSDLAELDGADLVIDASTPAVSIDVVRAAIERGINVLVGTSGGRTSASPSSCARGRCRSLLPSIEIVEAHRETKVDSPSGTAVRTAELIAAAREEIGPVQSPHVDQRARGQQVASVPIHSLRRPGVIARQETVLSGAGESLSIVHDTIDPTTAYAPGIRIAIAAALEARGVVVGRRRHQRMKTRIAVGLMTVLLLLYIVLAGQRSVVLLASGDGVGIAMGVALIVLPLIALWAIGRELWFGVRAQKLGEILDAEGALPHEEVALRPSGRATRDDADALFPAYRADVEQHPGDWRAWYRLGVAYDASGDRRRAREAVRTAIALEKSDRPAA
ncbi:hypothetical protein LUZ63_024129 [Rhynchospora breviuscula]|uniref:4-hydroxy-tetrahydrodipicolinate reductase n=1 Tax=Rhynchospora breviuscula TaxID=2022672 RepID=A0A9P9Z1Q7_9POAL|nr:hypothetical protein LUZ63_024129 [Rhynchospora breviuscula]